MNRGMIRGERSPAPWEAIYRVPTQPQYFVKVHYQSPPLV